MIIDLDNYKNRTHCLMLRLLKEYVKLCLPVPQKPAKVYKFPDITPNKLKELKL